jgi:hypothetical protein
MSRWNTAMEEELVVVLKDWLKHQGRTQADLRRSLKATSTRMPALIEVLEREHRLGGLPKLASRLCAIEADWARHPSAGEGQTDSSPTTNEADPFGQLDLLLQEIRDDSVS